MGNEKDSLSSYLANLMQHVIKWKSQPQKRTPSWVRSIEHARSQIKKIQQKKPSISRSTMVGLWDNAFRGGKKEAEKEMEKISDIESLSWQQVFEEKYELQDNYWKMWTVLLSIALLVWWVW